MLRGAAAAARLIVEGKEKAAVCWHLVTASHYCIDAIKYELDCLRVPRQCRCAPASFFSRMCGGRLTLPFSPRLSDDCSVGAVKAASTGTRPMFADQRRAGRSVRQTANPVPGEELVRTRHLAHYLHTPTDSHASCMLAH